MLNLPTIVLLDGLEFSVAREMLLYCRMNNLCGGCLMGSLQRVGGGTLYIFTPNAFNTLLMIGAFSRSDLTITNVGFRREHTFILGTALETHMRGPDQHFDNRDYFANAKSNYFIKLNLCS